MSQLFLSILFKMRNVSVRSPPRHVRDSKGSASRDSHMTLDFHYNCRCQRYLTVSAVGFADYNTLYTRVSVSLSAFYEPQML